MEYFSRSSSVNPAPLLRNLFVRMLMADVV